MHYLLVKCNCTKCSVTFQSSNNGEETILMAITWANGA